VSTPSRGALGVAVAATVIVALAGCGEATRGQARHNAGAHATRVVWRTYHDRRWGYRVAFPSGWHRATRNLTPNITDPVEILSVASFPFRADQTLCGTAGVLARVRPNGALVTIMERGIGAYGGPDFPARPARFLPDPRLPGRSEWPYCAAMPPNWRGAPLKRVPMLDYFFGFGDAGRAFHVLVAIGKSAPDRVRHQAFRILDSLQFDPNIKPGWHSSG
jgi:hypothetical protein